MKILFITEHLPFFPCHDGFRLIPYNLIQELSREHDIYLLSFYVDKNELNFIGSISKYCKVVDTVFFEYPKTKRESLRNLFLKYAWNEEMAGKIRQWLEKESFDLVHVEGASIGQYVYRSADIPKIICPHDSPSARAWQLLISRDAFLDKVKYFIQWVKAVACEKDIYSKFDHCVVVSPKDKEVIKRHAPGLNISVMSNGVDMHYYGYRPFEGREKNVIFTGNMSYIPNVDAALYFYHSIFPDIRKAVPEAKFYIVGARPCEEIQRLKADPNVVVTGTVDDIREYIYKASVYVCPMRYGTGIKNKILEAMSMGIAIVSTTNSVVGINVSRGQNIVVEDKPGIFAQRVIELLNDPPARLRLTEKARALIEAEYSWKQRSKDLNDIYRKLTP